MPRLVDPNLIASANTDKSFFNYGAMMTYDKRKASEIMTDGPEPMNDPSSFPTLLQPKGKSYIHSGGNPSVFRSRSYLEKSVLNHSPTARFSSAGFLESEPNHTQPVKFVRRGVESFTGFIDGSIWIWIFLFAVGFGVWKYKHRKQ